MLNFTKRDYCNVFDCIINNVKGSVQVFPDKTACYWIKGGKAKLSKNELDAKIALEKILTK